MISMSAFFPGLLIISVGFAILVSFPLFYGGKHRLRQRSELYHDEDGTTIYDFQAAFNRQSRTCIILLLSLNTIGLASNTAAAVLMSADLKDIPDRLQLLLAALKISAAALLYFQTVLIAITPSPVDRQTQAFIAGVCSLFVYGTNLWYDSRHVLTSKTHLTFLVIDLSLLLTSVSINLITGLALTFSLDLTQSVFWVLRRYADIEMDMNSLERISEFFAIPSEPSDGAAPPASWPTSGRVEVSNLVVAYGPDLPPVLRGADFCCEPNSRVGIVGRTGAGKSSLALALFRFLEARSGAIFIDGLDISTLALPNLGQRISIIPQHPVLWLGSIRSNLDTFGTYDDGQLREVLERVQLSRQTVPPPASSDENSNGEVGFPSSCFSAPPPSITLSTPVAEGGLNLSLGQRQLVCLARALLRRPKILIMDEAISAVDTETDALVQRSIRSELRGCTLIVIAHKLSTVIDLDKIVVLQEGRMVEMGTPKDLWGKGELSAEMVKQSGEKDWLEGLS